MRIAIMQPYLFPYLGYFQLMNAANKFLLLDDVNYINRGWVNRNYILLHKNPFRFTLPLQKASQNKRINETLIAADAKWKKKFMATLHAAYHQSPYYNEVIELIRIIIYFDDPVLSHFLQNSLQMISAFIGIRHVNISLTSETTARNTKGQERILELCSLYKADEYINLPSGKHLYDPGVFASRSISLLFIEPHLPVYTQQSLQEFLPGLSIIDVLMNNSKDAARIMVQDYDIVPE